MALDYDAYLANMISIVKSAKNASHVNYLYFNAGDLGQPLVNTYLTNWKLGTRDLYISPGTTDNYCYIYEKSSLKAFITYNNAGIRGYSKALNSRDFALIKEVQVVTQQSLADDEVYIGNHLDFSICRQKTGDILVKTHLTQYTDWDQPKATRDTQQYCNFNLDLNSLADINIFNKIGCDTMAKRVIVKNAYSIDSKYTDEDIEIVYHFLRMVTGKDKFQGGAPKQEYHRRHKVHIGKKGGKYILKNGKKKYVKLEPAKTGGAGDQDSLPSYKGIKLFTEQFIKYLQTTIFEAVKRNSVNLHSIEIYYDSQNELSSSGVDNVVFIYNFGNGQEHLNMFFVDMKTLLVNCYANSNPKIELEPEEQQYVDLFSTQKQLLLAVA